MVYLNEYKVLLQNRKIILMLVVCLGLGYRVHTIKSVFYWVDSLRSIQQSFGHVGTSSWVELVLSSR